jgi:hypothetical protein
MEQTQDIQTMPEADLAALDAPPVGANSFEEAAKEVFGDAAPAPAAEAAPEEESTVETEPPPPPDPKQESIARRIATAKRAEIRAAQERAELKAQRDAIEREKADLEAKAARYRTLEEDPVKAFEVLGLDPKTFLEKLAGEHNPANVQAKEIAALKAEIEALKTETTRERETAKQRELRLQSEQVWTEASQGFVKHIEATAEKYPHLVAEFTEGEAIAAAERALLEVVGTDDAGQPVTRAEAYRLQFGEYPDNDVIAEFLDTQAKARAEARQNSAWRKQVPANGSQPLSSGDPNPKAPPVIKGSSPRTLTSRAASEKATSISKQWTQEAADAESLRILEDALRKMG